ncbi:MAG TPA: 30S ribosomal protein S13 [Candidatus Norongarragalinales archaeon]|nr:30S ribosomal protein S13 [Candidatus Norongarragalinales archaeon]
MAEKHTDQKSDNKEKPKVAPFKKPVEIKKSGKEKENYRGIIRIVGKDLNGQFTLNRALRKIPGIGHTLAKNLSGIVAGAAGVAEDELVGNLTDVQLKKVEEVVKNPQGFGISSYLLNRPLHPQEGVPKHFVMADLTLAVRQDIDLQKDIRSYRGWRHTMGQKVRGQHTRSTGRTGMTVGVLKKALKAQKAAAATGAQEAGKTEKK